MTAPSTRVVPVEATEEHEIILAMCKAHDAEESAAIGEPSPWRDDFDRDPDWEQARFLAMREAFDVCRASLNAAPAAPVQGDEADHLLASANRIARRMGAEVVPDPQKVEAFRAGTPPVPGEGEAVARPSNDLKELEYESAENGQGHFAYIEKRHVRAALKYIQTLEARPAPSLSREDGLRERVARIICTTLDLDPDEHIIGGQAVNFEDFGPRWKAARHGHWHGFRDYEAAADEIIDAILAKGEGHE